ncbi:conserved exported protein of unknown function [Nitrospira japonica]|uniref:DUF3015 domain-containing protein n=1 Tax=Nitrospira japonica TaxID=1325564 RepID=A0A1W1I2F3_9BACT|nr:DUF3015 family protein [Nitrospira japonica]SLM47003.1 conserved exported protein of unknown function [Nitrospira japonica]
MTPLFKGTIAFLLSASFWPATIAYSATTNPDTGPGCGLGRQLWEDWKGKKQIAPQLFMASTNVTGSYTFAITSGTSGCSNDGTIWDSQKAGLFIDINYANVMDDMARGGGEHLASLAALLGVTQEEESIFFSLVQREAFFAAHGEPALLLERLVAVRHDLSQRRMLAASATRE